jgi:hypothetical protein
MEWIIFVIVGIISIIILVFLIYCFKYTMDILESGAESQYIMEYSTVRGEESVSSMRNMLARDPALMELESVM